MWVIRLIRLTCLIAVTVITKNKGRPLVTGLVGVSTITYWGEKINVMLTHNNKHMTFKLKNYALNTVCHYKSLTAAHVCLWTHREEFVVS